MKISTMVFLGLCISEVTLAQGLGSGTYKGSGLWHSKSESGTYQNRTVIEGDSIRTHYNLPDGSSRDWNFQMEKLDGNLINIKVGGESVGGGYCLDKAILCHYELSIGTMKLEETLVQEGSKMYRFGSKNEGQGLIMWQESLNKE